MTDHEQSYELVSSALAELEASEGAGLWLMRLAIGVLLTGMVGLVVSVF